MFQLNNSHDIGLPSEASVGSEKLKIITDVMFHPNIWGLRITRILETENGGIHTESIVASSQRSTYTFAIQCFDHRAIAACPGVLVKVLVFGDATMTKIPTVVTDVLVW